MPFSREIRDIMLFAAENKNVTVKGKTYLNDYPLNGQYH